MKKIIAIFIFLFFNITFSSSEYDQCMKRVQCFRSINHKTQTILRRHAAEQIAEQFNNNDLDTVAIKKTSPKQTKPNRFVKNRSSKTINNEEGVNDIKMLTMKIVDAFNEILKKNLLFDDSIIELEKSKEYVALIAKYPVAEKAEYKNMLHSILVKQYRNYCLLFIVKNIK